MNDLPIAGLGHNQPDPALTAALRVDALIETADAWAAKYPAIEVESVAAAANDFLAQMDAHWKEFDAARDAEKRPFDEASKAVQAKWKPLLDKIAACRRTIKSLHDGWLRLKARQLEDERRKCEYEAAEAQRRADQLTRQAQAGGPGTATNVINAVEAAQEAELAAVRAAAVPKRAQSRGALGGRPRSLRTVWLATVVEWNLLYEHYKDHPDVKNVLQGLADAAVRAKGGPRPPAWQKEGSNPNLPGVWIYSEEQ
jgi:hypothetical protein